MDLHGRRSSEPHELEEEVMSGPWEQYQQTEAAGPWEAYQQKTESAPTKSSGKPYSPEQEAIIADMKARPWGSGLPKAIYDLGGKVTDVTGSPVAGAITNFLGNAIPAFLTSGRLMDAPPTSLAEWPAKWLMQTSVKPTLAARKSGDAAKAMKTMLDEEIYPTMSGMEKAGELVGKLNSKVESAIASSPATVPVGAVTSRLNEPMQKFGMQVNPQADVSAVEDVWTKFMTNPHVAGKTEIPVQLAHSLKKGTYAAIGGKAYGEMGSAATEAQKALARGLREETLAAVPQIAGPLSREASLMNVRDVAMDRAILEANKNPMGLAALRMDSPISAASFMADRWAALKAFIALQAYHGAKPQMLSPLLVTGGEAYQDQGPALLRNLGALAK